MFQPKKIQRVLKSLPSVLLFEKNVTKSDIDIIFKIFEVCNVDGDVGKNILHSIPDVEDESRLIMLAFASNIIDN